MKTTEIIEGASSCEGCGGKALKGHPKKMREGRYLGAEQKDPYPYVITVHETPEELRLKPDPTGDKFYVKVKTTEPRGVPIHVLKDMAYTYYGSPKRVPDTDLRSRSHWKYVSTIKRTASKIGLTGVLMPAGHSALDYFGPGNWNNFKPTGLVFRFSKAATNPQQAEQAVKQLLDAKVAKYAKKKTKQDAYRAKAPERKKEAAKFSAAEQKKRLEGLYARYGKDVVERVKIRQIGGDDGYQYNVIVDGRSIMNGLTRSQAEGYRVRIWARLAKKKAWNALGGQGDPNDI